MQAEQVKKLLQELAEPDYRAFSMKLIPGAQDVLGVRMPALRQLAKGIAREDARAFLADTADGCHEMRLLRGLVIGCAPLPLEERLDALEAFLPQIDNWAVCDSSIAACGWLGRHRREAWERFFTYLHSRNEYEVRAFLVMLLFHFMEGEWVPRILEACRESAHEGYYAKMAAAWAISDCFVKEPERTLVFLSQEDLKADTRRMAIQKVLESRRVTPEQKAAARALKGCGHG